jgi:dihydroorotase
MLDLLVGRGLVIDEGGVREESLAIEGGRVVATIAHGEEPPAREVVDATGKMVLPGLIDSHVHFREPGLTHKEDFSTGTLAAAAGGVTTVMVMPTDNPFTLTPADFSAKRALAEGRTYVDFALQAGLGPAREHVVELADLGAISFEIFMSDLPAELLTGSAADMILSLEAVRDVGGVAGITPGDDSVYRQAKHAAHLEHGGNPRAFLQSRPPEAEALGVAQACIAAECTAARVHLRQISCALSVSVLQALRCKTVTAEVTPHNLLLDEDDFLRLGPVAKVAPPLRTPHDRDAVRRALAVGALDVIATDHAPHHPDEKAAGLYDIWKAPGGFPGVQTFLPLMLHLIEQGVLDYPGLVRSCCANPARLFGLYPRKGALKIGSDADLVIVDPQRPMTIRNEDQLSKMQQTPFEGLRIAARPVMAFLRGRLIMRDGRPAGLAVGRFVRA